MAFNPQGGLQPGLGVSNPNNFYSSGIAGSQVNGSGSQVQANKLNRNKNAAGVTVVPGPIQYVEQPVEVIKKVKKQVYAQTAAPSVQLNQLDPNLRNLIAETSAKIALLVMENNRIKWRIAQRDAEIARLRSQGGVITTSTAPVVRTSGTAVVNRAPVTTTLPTLGTAVPVARPGVALPTTTTTGGVVTRPATTTVSGVPATSTVRPAGTTTVSGLPR